MSTCSICLNRVTQSFTLECGHKFHIKCLNFWRQHDESYNGVFKFNCACCRQPIDWSRPSRNDGILVKYIKNLLLEIQQKF